MINLIFSRSSGLLVCPWAVMAWLVAASRTSFSVPSILSVHPFSLGYSLKSTTFLVSDMISSLSFYIWNPRAPLFLQQSVALALFHLPQRFSLLESLINRLCDFRVSGHFVEKSLPIFYSTFIVLCLESRAAREFQSLQVF